MIDIIIPFYSRADMLAACLRKTLASVEDATVLVVDDSVDLDQRHMCEEFCRMLGCALLVNKNNVGFIGATRRGAAALTGEFILFLNSDTEPTAWGWLAEMAEAMADPTVAVVGAKLVFGNGTIQHAGVARIDAGWPFHPFMHLPGDTPAANEYRDNINAVTGGCMLVRRSVWAELGGWDPKFGRGVFEDVDFCWRARKAGHKVVYQPKACLIHHQSQSLEPDGTHSLHGNSGANGVYLRDKWQGIQGDEHLFGLPKHYPQQAPTKPNEIQLDVRLIPIAEVANGGNPLAQQFIVRVLRAPITERPAIQQAMIYALNLQAPPPPPKWMVPTAEMEHEFTMADKRVAVADIAKKNGQTVHGVTDLTGLRPGPEGAVYRYDDKRQPVLPGGRKRHR